MEQQSLAHIFVNNIFSFIFSFKNLIFKQAALPVGSLLFNLDCVASPHAKSPHSVNPQPDTAVPKLNLILPKSDSKKFFED